MIYFTVEQTGASYLGHRVEVEVIGTLYSAGEDTCACVKLTICVDHNFLVGYFLIHKHTHKEENNNLVTKNCKRKTRGCCL